MPRTARSSASERKLRISIVGAGRMGTALGSALRREGHHIEIVVTKRASHARRAAKIVGGAIPITRRQLMDASNPVTQAIFNSDLVIVSTPDDAFEVVAAELAAVFRGLPKTRRPKPAALHTSGAVSSDVLQPLRKLGLPTGSMHPLVSVTDTAVRSKPFRGVHFCLEGDAQAMRIARTVVRELGGHPFSIQSAMKPLYHAAAVMASGHVVALIDVAIEMLTECGLSERRAQQILLPLLVSTVENLTTKTPAKSLTGPFSRRDAATIRRHLAAMKAKKLTNAEGLYSALGARAIRLMGSEVASAKATRLIEKLLKAGRERVP